MKAMTTITCNQCKKDFDPSEATRLFSAHIPEFGFCSDECYASFIMGDEPRERVYRIKPLEWMETEFDIYASETTDGGRYFCGNDGKWVLLSYGNHLIEEGLTDSIEAAKAAANAHHIQQVERYLEEIK